jgi:hypothetical protein
MTELEITINLVHISNECAEFQIICSVLFSKIIITIVNNDATLFTKIGPRKAQKHDFQ